MPADDRIVVASQPRNLVAIRAFVVEPLGGLANRVVLFRTIPGRDPAILRISRDDLDLADNVTVEFRQVFGRHPKLNMVRPADDPTLETGDIDIVDFKCCYEAAIIGIRLRRIPVTGNLFRVGKVQHGIINRLFGKSRRERAKSAVLDKRQLLRPDGSVQHHLIAADHLSMAAAYQ